jgi:indole-3-glycerol phosphate synthase
MSVLTDREYFGGAVADLQAARDAVDIPILRKDFTIDEVQVYEARAIGADAILLILAALPDDAHLLDLHDLARSLGLGVLVEAHDAAEVERGVSLGVEVLGVNARDLATFGEDLGAAASASGAIPATTIAVAESAIRGIDDASAMAAVGFDAVLVGEALVRSPDPTALVAAMTSVTVRRRGG